MSNHLTVVGTVATVPRLVGAGTPTQLCTFRLASNERWYSADKGEWIDGPTSWFTVNAFRGLGSHAQESLAKGDRVIVHGRLRVREWTSRERSGTTAEIDADALGPDLRWGVSAFTRQSFQGPAADPPTAAADIGAGQQQWNPASSPPAQSADGEAMSSDGFTPQEAERAA